jgi:hypothetical protein
MHGFPLLRYPPGFDAGNSRRSLLVRYCGLRQALLTHYYPEIPLSSHSSALAEHGWLLVAGKYGSRKISHYINLQ